MTLADHTGDNLRAQIRSSMESLHQVQRDAPYTRGFGTETRQLHPQLIRVLETVLLAADTLLGECRQATPFAPLQPTIDAHGDFRWCCTHDPEHCAS